MALIEKLTAIADAIRGKTGKEDALTLDQMATEIEGMETGDEVFISSPTGQYYGGIIYTKHVVWPGTVGTLAGCEYLESIYAPESTISTIQAVFDCQNLKSMKFPKQTVYCSYFVRNQFIPYGSLAEIEIGSIGYPVTRIDHYRWLYGLIADNCKLTVYVDAETIADISTDVTTNVNGNISTGSLDIIYRNSTTGEVITE